MILILVCSAVPKMISKGRKPILHPFIVLFLGAAFIFIIFVLSLCSTKSNEYYSIVRFDKTSRREKPSLEACDVFSGRWVYDDSNHPLYSGLNCSFMNDEVACDKFGRSDVKYQHWRWQPYGCDLPRYDLFSVVYVQIYILYDTIFFFRLVYKLSS